MPKPQDSLYQQLARYNLSPEEFDSFVQRPFAEVLNDIQRSVASGGNTPLPFDMTHAPVLGSFVQKTGAVTQADRIIQILCDRPMQSYLIRYFGDGNLQELKTRTTIKGIKHLKDAAEQGRNICLLNSHFGCGQLVPIILGQLGFKITSLSYLNRYKQVGLGTVKNVDVAMMQDAFPAKILATGLQALKTGQIIHMAPDAQKGSSGQLYEFFGRKRKFASGFSYFGVRAKAVCLPVFCAINAMGQMTLIIEPPLKMKPNGPADKQIDHLTSQYVEALKSKWLSHPANIMPHVLFRHIKNTRPKTPNKKTHPQPATGKSWEQKWSDDGFNPVWKTETIPAEIMTLLEQKRLMPKTRVLDVGCGSGHIAHYLAEQNITAVGWDIAPSAIEKARAAYVKPSDLKGGLKLHYAVKNILHLKDPKPRFDWILDRGCLHTFKGEDRRTYFRNCAALIKPGGHMLILHKNLKNADTSEKTPRQVMRDMIREESYPFFKIESAQRTRFSDGDSGGDKGPIGFALILKR